MTDTTGHAELIARLRAEASLAPSALEDSLYSEAADALAKLDEECRQTMVTIEEQYKRAERAESAVAQARKDALEECAKIADDAPNRLAPAMLCQKRTAKRIGAAIRALITKG